jgi:hypothetical protein
LSGPAGRKGVDGSGGGGGAGSGIMSVSGTFAAPNLVTTSVSAPANERQKVYIQGNGGSQTLTASPRIGAGTTDGQELLLCGTSNTNTVIIPDGQGVAQNGSVTLSAHSQILYSWNSGSSLWVEVSRNDI